MAKNQIQPQERKKKNPQEQGPRWSKDFKNFLITWNTCDVNVDLHHGNLPYFFMVIVMLWLFLVLVT